MKLILAAGLLAGLVPGLEAQQPGTPPAGESSGLPEPVLPDAFGLDGDSQEYLAQFQDPSLTPGTLGASRLLGQTGPFSNEFNPAIGLVLDVLGEFSEVSGGASRFNRVRVRSVELNAASRIDPLGWAYVTVAFADEGAERVTELEEAAVWLDDFLPDTFTIRAGRFLADFGKWNTLHTHDKPFVSEDLVRNQYFGGPLFLEGAEIHHWFGLGDTPIRWTLGIASQAEGDDHDGQGFATGGGAPAFGRKGIDNWAATARVTGQHDVGDNGYFQWGVSGFFTPGMLEFTPVPPGTGPVLRSEVRNAVLGTDLTYRNVDATDLTGDTAGVEFWHQRGQVVAPLTGIITSGNNNGIWGFYEHAFSPYLAAGADASWVELRDSGGNSHFLTGGFAASRLGVFVSWYLSEFNRLRLEIDHTNPGISREKFFSVAVQWSVILGSHSHALDW